MQPYQRADEEIKRQNERPVTFLKKAGSALGGAALTGIGMKIMPMLSQYLPEEMAIKGLSKIDPRFGKFVEKAMSEGYDFNEVRNFIGGKFEEFESEKASEKAKDDKSIIEQYDPELHKYISMKIKEGLSPQKAASKAMGHGRFRKAIEKMVKDHKTPWASIIENVFGSSEMGQQANEAQQQQVQQPQQTSAGHAALLQAIQRLQQARGA